MSSSTARAGAATSAAKGMVQTTAVRGLHPHAAQPTYASPNGAQVIGP